MTSSRAFASSVSIHGFQKSFPSTAARASVAVHVAVTLFIGEKPELLSVAAIAAEKTPHRKGCAIFCW